MSLDELLALPPGTLLIRQYDGTPGSFWERKVGGFDIAGIMYQWKIFYRDEDTHLIDGYLGLLRLATVEEVKAYGGRISSCVCGQNILA